MVVAVVVLAYESAPVIVVVVAAAAAVDDDGKPAIAAVFAVAQMPQIHLVSPTTGTKLAH